MLKQIINRDIKDLVLVKYFLNNGFYTINSCDDIEPSDKLYLIFPDTILNKIPKNNLGLKPRLIVLPNPLYIYYNPASKIFTGDFPKSAISTSYGIPIKSENSNLFSLTFRGSLNKPRYLLKKGFLLQPHSGNSDLIVENLENLIQE